MDSCCSDMPRGGKQEKTRERLAKKAMTKHAQKATEKGEWKRKVGAIVALFFLCGMGFFQFLSTVLTFIQGDGIVRVDVQDTAQVKSVLFGGEPWLVYCVNNETADHRLPSILEESTRTLQSSIGLNVAVLHCWEKSASGRSVAERFKLNLKPPLSFVVANGNSPRVLSWSGVSNVEDVQKKVKPALEVKTYKIDTLKKWGSLCTSRKTCVVIGHKNTANRDLTRNLFTPLLKDHRATKVVMLDTSFWQLKLDDAVLESRSGRKGGEVLCLSRIDGVAPGSNVTHRGTFLRELDESTASSFLTACERGEGLSEIGEPPKIKARPSKPKKAAPAPAPRPQARPEAQKAKRGSQDHVGSREALDREEALFEDVDEDDGEEDQEGGEEDDDESEDDEVEL